MKFRILSLLFAVLAVTCLFTACDMMKNVQDTCSVSGTVYLNGRPLPNPEVFPYHYDTDKAVSIHNDEDQLIGRENGHYAIRKLPPGKYKLKVSTREGKMLTPPGKEIIVELRLGQMTERDIKLTF